MVRLKSQGTALATVICAGLACAYFPLSQQSAAQTPTTNAKDNVVTLEEPGKPAQKYVIQKTYRTADGKTAQEMRNLATGEVSTFFMDGKGTSTSTTEQTVPNSGKQDRNLVQWIKSKQNTSTPEVVQERSVVVPKTTEFKAQTPIAAAPTSNISTVSVQYRTVEEPGKPALKCRVTASWRTADGKKVSQLQAVETNEMVTIVESGPVEGATGDKGKVTAMLYHWANSTTPPPGVPTAPTSVASTTVQPVQALQPIQNVQKAPEYVPPPPGIQSSSSDQGRPSLMDHIRGAFGGRSTSREVVIPAMPATAQAAPMPAAKTVDAPRTQQVKNSETTKSSDDPSAAFPSNTIKASEAPKLMPSLPPLPLDVQTETPAQQMPKASKTASDTPPPPAPLPSATDPSLPPTTAMVGSNFGKKDDPLSNPECLLLPGSENRAAPPKVPPSYPSSGSASASDMARPVARPVPGSASVMAANGDYPGYLPTTNVSTKRISSTAAATASSQAAPELTNFANAFSDAPSTSENVVMMPPGYGPTMMPMPGPGRGQVPMSYQGPMPPNPTGSNMDYNAAMMAQMYSPPMMPQGYPMPMIAQSCPAPMVQAYPVPMMQGYPVPQQGLAMANPAMDRRGAPPAVAAQNAPMSVQQCLSVLQTSIFPTQREMAVDRLTTCDWRSNPQIVQILLLAAKEDPAPMVRVAAVSGLARMGVATESAITIYNQLKNDSDPRVRMEAEQALNRR